MKIYTRRYNDFIENTIERIDNEVEEYVEDHTGYNDIDDEDIQEKIAESIIYILEELEITNKNNKLFKILKVDMIQNYVNYMFRNWYTGEKQEFEYEIGINKFIEENN